MDILVAWHIDCSQKNDVLEFTSKALVDLRGFWLNDIAFTTDLLYQFLEDTESYMNVTATFFVYLYLNSKFFS